MRHVKTRTSEYMFLKGSRKTLKNIDHILGHTDTHKHSKFKRVAII